MERSPEFYTSDAAGAVPGKRIGLNEHSQILCRNAWHALHSLAFVRTECGVVRSVDVDAEQGNPADLPLSQCRTLPARKKQALTHLEEKTYLCQEEHSKNGWPSLEPRSAADLAKKLTGMKKADDDRAARSQTAMSISKNTADPAKNQDLPP